MYRVVALMCEVTNVYVETCTHDAVLHYELVHKYL